MKKYISSIFVILAVALFAVGCASGTAAAAATASPVVTEAPAATAATSDAATTTDAASTVVGSAADGTLELTLEQLKQYDGQNGNPAYVAVDGVIYDMTNVSEWKNGEHNGYTAGQDLTDIIKNKSPHGVSKLNGVPVVGKLVDG